MARQLIETIESRSVLILNLLILSVLTFPAVFHFVFADRTPPVVSFTQTEALNSPVAPGEALLVRIWRKKVREDCPVESRRYAISDNGVTVDIPDGKWIGGPVGDEYLDFAYPTPNAIPQGNYTLLVHLTYSCPNVREKFEYDQPPTPFRVRHKGETK